MDTTIIPVTTNAPAPVPQWKKLLINRGLLSAATQANWQPNGSGWKYPVYDLDEKRIENVYRWKAFDSSNKPKYLWEPKESTNRPSYYILPGTRAAIDKSNGIVIVASGEPDVLAFRAAGAENVLCWYGEGMIPVSLVTDLKTLGVSRVECYPDLDDTGKKWAVSIAQKLNESGIVFVAYALPGAAGSKTDINRIWINCGFDQDKFWTVLSLTDSMSIVLPPPQLPLPTKTETKTEYDDLPEGFYNAIERGLGVKEYKEDGWSKPIKCPLKYHEHDENHPAASWHKEKRILSCLKCDTKTLAIGVGEALGLRWIDFIPAEPTKTAEATITTEPRAEGAKVAGQPSITFGYKEASALIMDELDGNLKGGIHEPLPMPFTAIRALGGLAASLAPGKIIAIAGDSGDGKSSLLETLWEYWMSKGFHGIVWGPEWTKEEYVYRSIQRQEGPSVMDIIGHRAWHAGKLRGEPEGKRYGKPLTQAQIDKAKAIIKRINEEWPGKIAYVDKMGISATQLIKCMSDFVAKEKQENRRISFAVLDYIQLLRTSSGGKSNESLDQALADFKAFCVDKQLVGLVATQVTKADGRAQANGAVSTQHVMQNVRSDYFNLILTINRPVDDFGQRSETASVRIAKNSLGQNGEVKLIINGPRLLWQNAKEGAGSTAGY